MLGQLLRNLLHRFGHAGAGSPLRQPDALAQALELIERNDLAAARRLLEGVVTVRPHDAEALHQLGRIAHAQGRLSDAADWLERAQAARPDSAAIRVTYGNLRRARGELDAAQLLYAQAIGIEHGCIEARINLGMVLCERGAHESGIEVLREASRIDSGSFEAHHNLGIALGALGRHREAVESLQQAARIRPSSGTAQTALGASLQALGRNEDALAAYGRALSGEIDAAEVRYRMGNAYYEMRRLHEARSCIESAIASRPDLPGGRNGLGIVLLELGDLAGAIAEFERAIELEPALAEAHNNLGMALHRSGRPGPAQAAFRRALELRPDFAEAHSNLIVALGFDAAVAPAEQLAERRRWQERHARDLRAQWRRHGNDRNPERKLRIGYVSADFRRHSAICGFGPMLLHYDRAAYEVVCYSNSAYEDEFTHRFRESVDRWVSVFALPDEAAADLVRQHGVDLLVDLSAHSAGNRLTLFARKPAPIQISAWGFANGTGLDAIDYLFSDETTIPPASAGDYSEEVVYLPCVLTYLLQGEPPPTGPLAAERSGHITYGSFNSHAKLSPQSLELWARLLARTPGSSMLFKAGEFSHPQPRARVVEAFARNGVGAERIEFAGATPWREHLAAHGSVDVALDPVPHGGGISTLDALWMGVPVVALRGATVGGRTAASILTVTGLGDWVADSEEDYLAIASRPAHDIGRLARLRATLRDRVAATPAGNPRAYASAVEAVYRKLWRRWCAAPAAAVPGRRIP